MLCQAAQIPILKLWKQLWLRIFIAEFPVETMNPNHPHYAGLGGVPNINLLDNMLMAAGFQVISPSLLS